MEEMCNFLLIIIEFSLQKINLYFWIITKNKKNFKIGTLYPSMEEMLYCKVTFENNKIVLILTD